MIKPLEKKKKKTFKIPNELTIEESERLLEAELQIAELSKQEVKSKKGLKDKLWKLFSQYIRLRDAEWNGNAPCISCGKVIFWKDLDAGHFIAKNCGNFFYFLEDNVHAQIGRAHV